MAKMRRSSGSSMNQQNSFWGTTLSFGVQLEVNCFKRDVCNWRMLPRKNWDFVKNPNQFPTSSRISLGFSAKSKSGDKRKTISCRQEVLQILWKSGA